MGTQKRLSIAGEESTGPVSCLGKVFEDSDKRRKAYLKVLETKLQDTEFRSAQGFPVANDEEILALSDPPFFTACPNPFIADFVKHFGRAYDEANDEYHRTPFAADVSEGKNEAIYNTHSYHTKVPHKAIMRYILHYTEPGDIVFDGFCGSGMTGVASQLCGDRATVQTLGYSLKSDGTVIDENGDDFSKLGERYCVQVDLSPIATYIAYNQNTPTSVSTFEDAMEQVMSDVESQYGWLYRTTSDATELGVYHTVWSEVLLCNSCGGEIRFWDGAVDLDSGSVKRDVTCPTCKASFAKRELSRVRETVFSDSANAPVEVGKFVPVSIREIKSGSKKHRHLNDSDRQVLRRLEDLRIPFWYPTASIDRDIDLWYERDYRSLGLYTLDGFYTKRNLLAFAALWERVQHTDTDGRTRNAMIFTLTAMVVNLSRMNRWRPKVSFPYNPISGTLYVPSLSVESNVFYGVRNKAKRAARLWEMYPLSGNVCISTQSCTSVNQLGDSTVDYIFTDPPFGSNIIYSDLSLLHESWLKTLTNTSCEAVVHRRKKEGQTLGDYSRLMTHCFQEYYRVLKPARWMTVEFHNSKNSVWNAIQESLQEAGFVVGDVRILDKQQGSFKQVTAAGAVKQDLIISAYKPQQRLENEFSVTAGTESGAWNFVRSHLAQLPVFVTVKGKVEVIAEREDYLLFDRMVAFHVQRGVSIPMSAAEFYEGLRKQFAERDGMFFLSEQVTEYDKQRMTVQEVEQMELFISDELSAIKWIKRQLKERPQTFSELQPQFMREVAGWEKYEKSLELSDLLSENFLCYDGSEEVPSQIHSYLSSNFKELRSLSKADAKLRAKAKDRWYVPDPRKEKDIEKVRHRALMKEFNDYRQSKGKLKVVRMEALRAGFKECWQTKDLKPIIEISRRVKEDIIQEDPALLMYYDNAVMLSGAE